MTAPDDRARRSPASQAVGWPKDGAAVKRHARLPRPSSAPQAWPSSHRTQSMSHQARSSGASSRPSSAGREQVRAASCCCSPPPPQRRTQPAHRGSGGSPARAPQDAAAVRDGPRRRVRDLLRGDPPPHGDRPVREKEELGPAQTDAADRVPQGGGARPPRDETRPRENQRGDGFESGVPSGAKEEERASV